VQSSPVVHAAGDSFVLCSDGLTDLVDDDEILSIVERDAPADAVVNLVDLAKARGGHDNTTVLVLRAQDNARLTLATTSCASHDTGALSENTHAQDEEGQGSNPSERQLETPAVPERVAMEPAKLPVPIVTRLLWVILIAGALALAFEPHLRHLVGR
jgi:hypothetical protein